MPLAPIPLKTSIVDKLGAINIFFRQRWEELRSVTAIVAAKAIYSASDQNAAIATQLVYTITAGGYFEVTFSARRTTVDGVASTLTFTWHWTDGGTPFSKAAPINSTDTTGDLYTGTATFPADVNTNVTFDMAYTSNTPGAMRYKVAVAVKQLTQV